jgi:hypothetical protein
MEDNPMSRIKATVLTLCISVIGGTAALAQDMLLWTPGVSKCSDYLQADKRIQLEMTGWVLGFMAGLNAGSMDALAAEAAPLNPDVDWAMLWKHCHEHPGDTIVQVAVAMESEFFPKR